MALVAPDWPKTPSPATSSNQMDSSPSRQQSQDPSTSSVQAAASNTQQQQPAAWTPSPTAAPFYPSFTPFFAPGQPAPPAQQQFYDPNFAQWAYHQMIMSQPHLMNQHAQVLPFPPQQLPAQVQGQQQQQQLFAPFNPSPRPSPAQEMPANYQGFHPYRRPGRPQQDVQHIQPHLSSQMAPQPDWSRQTPPPQPPYARGEASGSQTSLGGSSNGSSRSRVNSNSTPPSSLRNRPPAAPSPPPAASSFGRSSPVPAGRAPHQRVNSSSSERSSSSTTRGVRPASPAPAQQTRPSAAPVKPSPLSQGQSISTAEKRMSKDDSELISETAAHAAASPLGRPSGLKGRLRRAFSFNAAGTLETGASGSSSGERTKDKPGQAPVTDPDAPGAPPKRSRAASLFNPRFNRSTDNISLSSTVSSASVMIRKIGNMGKLARRNTLSGITSIFKDKDKKDGLGEGSKSRAEPAVSFATAEFDRVNSDDPDMVGLSPAAQLARQHTLRSNAQEAAERLKAGPERRAASSSSQRGAGPRHIYEDGRRIIVEDDEEDSGSDTDRGHRSDEENAFDEEDLTIRMNNTGLDDEDDNDVEWAVGIRRSLERVRQPTKGILKRNYDQDEYLESVLKAAHPAQTQRPRSNSYGPASQGHEGPGPLARIPSPDPDHIDGLHHKDGSSHGHEGSHGSHKPHNNPHLPRFSFEFTGEIKLTTSPPPSPPPSSNGHSKESVKERESIKDKSPYNHPSFNSSAPVLSLALGNGAPLAPRSATAPAKRITFAPNLSIYDTFSAATYDRRSEAATCNRLTPALAQRIKEELNSYKMEEMEVHVASRIHTHFFV